MIGTLRENLLPFHHFPIGMAHPKGAVIPAVGKVPVLCIFSAHLPHRQGYWEILVAVSIRKQQQQKN